MFAVLEPHGLIALQERSLIFNAVELMLIVVIPVFTLAFFFAWWYRAGNTKANYMPHWQNAMLDEFVWWVIPFEIVLVLGALTWSSTHALDPAKPIAVASGEAPLVVQVVALEWKWLFIYPEQNIASVNFVQIPVDRPVVFEITADAPMNSFWVPQLGGQIYAMTGMVTHLNLIANTTGNFAGRSANYSGAGFAQMKFNVKATSQADFDAWISETKQSSQMLNQDAYVTLAKPSIVDHPDTYANDTITMYSSVQNGLYNSIVMKFMQH